MTGSEETPSFRLAYVPGVTPTKWVRIWNERLPGIPLTLVPAPAAEAYDVLRDGGADAGFVRLPADRTYFSAIPLYTETTVVVVPKDHLFTAADEITVEELADEIVLHPLDDTLGWERPPGQPAFERPATTADAIELVAAGIGLLVVPQSLARLYHRKDLKYRTLTDAPQSQVALAWPEERTTDQVEDFIGIVRGRTVNSTRGRARPEATERPKSRQSGKGGARQKAVGGKPAGKSPRGPRSGSATSKSAKGRKPRRRS
ncbi:MULTISPECIES: LysR family transcriptional regulator substrate-binding protein [Streptomyces]|uniref:LysR family transcriptional regulator substrate-binding protein n=1 Tax=Streptomyces TaxID=1883 RepID=UPI0006B2A624|nr:MULTISPECIES: LysR family transcriptional regulator substrate-binding protein [Streptomyces]